MKNDSLPSPKPEAFKEYEKYSAILESIAEKFENDPIKREVLKKAAYALLFSTVYFGDEFEQFMLQTKAELTENQLKRLHELE